MYQIVIEKRAEKFIRKQPKPMQVRLLTAISKLPQGDIKALKGHENLYRLRVGGELSALPLSANAGYGRRAVPF